MENLKAIIGQRKMAVLAAIFLLVVFIGFSVTSAMKVAHRREQDASQRQQEEMAQPDDGGEEGPPLEESQQALIDSYPYRTKKLIETLCVGVWNAGGGKYTLRFYDTYYVETVNGNESAHSFAISAVEYGTNGSDTEIDTIVFETDTGSHIATFSLVRSAESEQAGKATIGSSTMFSSADIVYERIDGSTDVEIIGLNDEITLLLGDMDKLNEELSSWCSVHYPAMAFAVWSENATIDYGRGVVVTSFFLGDADADIDALSDGTSVAISITYDQANDTYEFGL